MSEFTLFHNDYKYNSLLFTLKLCLKNVDTNADPTSINIALFILLKNLFWTRFNLYKIHNG